MVGAAGLYILLECWDHSPDLSRESAMYFLMPAVLGTLPDSYCLFPTNGDGVGQGADCRHLDKLIDCGGGWKGTAARDQLITEIASCSSHQNCLHMF